MKRILVIAVLCLLMATPLASAEKCDFAGNTAAGIQKCFGASGQHCEGEPNHGTQKNDKDCTVTAWVSVGSIMHDNCCLDDEKGKWCEGIGKGVWDDVTFKDDSTPCSREWRKAVYNSRDGRGFWWKFGPYYEGKGGDDLRSAKDETRSAVTTDHFGGSRQTAKVKERAASRRLKAPSGTALDYEDKSFCSMESFQPYQDPLQWFKTTDKHYMVGVSDWGICR